MTMSVAIPDDDILLYIISIRLNRKPELCLKNKIKFLAQINIMELYLFLRVLLRVFPNCMLCSRSVSPP